MKSIEINKLNISEKFILMEKLCDDLSSNPEEKELSPKWHFETLTEREEGIKNGKYSFNEFDDVKKRLQNL